jgi:hypothetical protein
MGYFNTEHRILSINTGNELCKGKTIMGRYSTKNIGNNCKNLKHAVKPAYITDSKFKGPAHKLSVIFGILGRQIPEKLEKYKNDNARVTRLLPKNSNSPMYVIKLVGKGIYIKIPNTNITRNRKKQLQYSKLAEKAQAQRTAVATAVQETLRLGGSTIPV